MKFRNILALAATTAALALAPVAHADDISGKPDPTTGLGAPIAKDIRLFKLVFNDTGLRAISVSEAFGGEDSPEESYLYFSDKEHHVYQCHNVPSTTAMVNIHCDEYAPKK